MAFTRVNIKQLLAWIILPLFLLFLSACTTSKTYQASAEQKYIMLPQAVASIKQDIASDPRYQKGTESYLAKKYLDYVNGLVEQVKNKKISEADAQALLVKTYKQFKAGKYNLRKENMMYVAPEPTSLPTPQEIPEKPGAL